MIRAGIIGANGYTGGELMRLLAAHPKTEVVYATSRSEAGKKVSDVHEHLKGFCDLKFTEASTEDLAKNCDVVFLAVPHGTAMDYVPDLLNLGKCKIVDLSADYRLSVDVFEKVYNMKHKDPRCDIVYGIPELHSHKKIKESRLVSNPGCFPTGASLAAAPLAAAGVIKTVIFDSKTGISGAGNKPSAKSHFPNLTENIIPYNLTAHRHIAEMKQEIQRFQPEVNEIYFTPHIIAATRGILTTAHIILDDKVSDGREGRISTEKLVEKYNDFYANSPFVRVISEMPSLANVRGSNFCDIYVEVQKDANRAVIISAIDNLVKGASGQAIQNMNIMFGLDETEGLFIPSMP